MNGSYCSQVDQSFIEQCVLSMAPFLFTAVTSEILSFPSSILPSDLSSPPSVPLTPSLLPSLPFPHLTLMQGRFSLAARYHSTVAEIYENELLDFEEVHTHAHTHACTHTHTHTHTQHNTPTQHTHTLIMMSSLCRLFQIMSGQPIFTGVKIQ